LIKEKQSKQIQRLLTEQIEKLKKEKGLNRVGLNKDLLISKMKSQIESLQNKHLEYENHIKESRVFAVQLIEMLKDERN